MPVAMCSMHTRLSVMDNSNWMVSCSPCACDTKQLHRATVLAKISFDGVWIWLYHKVVCVDEDLCTVLLSKREHFYRSVLFAAQCYMLVCLMRHVAKLVN